MRGNVGLSDARNGQAAEDCENGKKAAHEKAELRRSDQTESGSSAAHWEGALRGGAGAERGRPGLIGDIEEEVKNMVPAETTNPDSAATRGHFPTAPESRRSGLHTSRDSCMKKGALDRWKVVDKRHAHAINAIVDFIDRRCPQPFRSFATFSSRYQAALPCCMETCRQAAATSRAVCKEETGGCGPCGETSDSATSSPFAFGRKHDAYSEEDDNNERTARHSKALTQGLTDKCVVSGACRTTAPACLALVTATSVEANQTRWLRKFCWPVDQCKRDVSRVPTVHQAPSQEEAATTPTTRNLCESARPEAEEEQELVRAMVAVSHDPSDDVSPRHEKYVHAHEAPGNENVHREQ